MVRRVVTADDTPLQKVVARNIHDLRESRGMSQRDLAGKWYTPAYISAIERVLARPSFSSMRHIAGRLGVTVPDLFYDPEEKELMSVQSDVHSFLASVAQGTNGDFVPMDPGKLAEQVGTTRNKVNKTLFNLTQSGKIELQRGQNGRSITGFKLLAGPSEVRPRTIPRGGRQRLSAPATIQPGQTIRRRTIQTPRLDEYEQSKSKFERLTAELGDLVTAEFRHNPYAEEGLALRERLNQIEGTYAEVVSERDRLQRDVRALRGRNQRELAESVASESSVTSGD